MQQRALDEPLPGRTDMTNNNVKETGDWQIRTTKEKKMTNYQQSNLPTVSKGTTQSLLIHKKFWRQYRR